MQVAPTAGSGRRRARCSKPAFSGSTSVAPRRSDAILEALRPGADGPASEDGTDGAIATMTTIVTTTGPPHQACGAAQAGGGMPRGGRAGHRTRQPDGCSERDRGAGLNRQTATKRRRQDKHFTSRASEVVIASEHDAKHDLIGLLHQLLDHLRGSPDQDIRSAIIVIAARNNPTAKDASPTTLKLQMYEGLLRNRARCSSPGYW
jgi:hypothetical protein